LAKIAYSILHLHLIDKNNDLLIYKTWGCFSFIKTKKDMMFLKKDSGYRVNLIPKIETSSGNSSLKELLDYCDLVGDSCHFKCNYYDA